MILTNPTGPLPCPHCGEHQEDTAKEHLVPSKPHILQSYDCVHCDKPFTVVGNPDGTISVEQA